MTSCKVRKAEFVVPSGKSGLSDTASPREKKPVRGNNVWCCLYHSNIFLRVFIDTIRYTQCFHYISVWTPGITIAYLTV
jgi:hypothetical protein